jgi:hypothetical protein
MSKLHPESDGSLHGLHSTPAVVLGIFELQASAQQTEDLCFRLEQPSRILDITLSSISDFA